MKLHHRRRNGNSSLGSIFLRQCGWYNMRYMASNELDLQMVSAMIITL